jgi:CDP-glucose 4,6-dehydratase
VKGKPFDDFYRRKRVLITGHTGFKGSWLSIWLLELNADVIGYALPPPTDPSLFETCGLRKKINSWVGDIRDRKMLQEVVERFQPEIVFHMAAQALVRRSYREPVETYETNIMGTVNLLEVCRHAPSVKVIINVTSDKCYENKEWLQGYRETDTMGGSDPYSSSKGCAELITSAYRKSYFNPTNFQEHSKALASVRAGNVIGGGDWAEDRLIPDCIKACISQKSIRIRYPEAIRPWQHVLEPLSGYLLLGQYLQTDGASFMEAWNFGPNDADAKPVRWIVERVTQLWQDNACWAIDENHHLAEAHYLKLDCSKANTKLDWFPQWNLEIALAMTISWYKACYNCQDMFKFTIDQIHAYEECMKRGVKK